MEETKTLQMEVVRDDQMQMDKWEKANIDSLVSTAKKYPRVITQCKKEALSLVTLDEETAASCFYKLPRAGKIIEGPSVRLAEIVCSTWGNIRAGARPIGNDGKYVTAQGFCHDVEKNVFIAIESKRKITNKHGETFNEDMQSTTENANRSIAMRNAMFAVIPRAYVNSLVSAAKQVAIGDIKTLVERRSKALDCFAKAGIDPERVYFALGVKGVEDITIEKLELLIGMWTALKDGEETADALFPPIPKKPKIGQEQHPVVPAAQSSEPQATAPALEPEDDIPMNTFTPDLERPFEWLKEQMGKYGITDKEVLNYCIQSKLVVVKEKQTEIGHLSSEKLKVVCQNFEALLKAVMAAKG